jgi:hypothetical protein
VRREDSQVVVRDPVQVAVGDRLRITVHGGNLKAQVTD